MTVYFVQSEVGSKHIKIGYFKDDGEPPLYHSARIGRFHTISHTLGLPLRWLAETRGLRFVEAWFHKRHGASASGREWHKPSPALLSDIEVLASGRRLMGQPTGEPSVNAMPPSVARLLRVEYFRMTRGEMADALGFTLSTIANGEVSHAPITRVIDYAAAAGVHGVGLALDDILQLCADPERPMWRRFPRFRTFAVRDAGEVSWR